MVSPRPVILSIQITTRLVNTDQERISIRKCSCPEAKAQMVYKALGYKQKPFIRKKSVVSQNTLKKNESSMIQDFNSG